MARTPNKRFEPTPQGIGYHVRQCARLKRNHVSGTDGGGLFSVVNKPKRIIAGLLIAVSVIVLVGVAVRTYTYMHPLNRYQRASMSWIEEHNAIVEAEHDLLDEFKTRPDAEGFRSEYEQRITRRWSDLQAEVEAYDAPVQLDQSHTLLLEAISEQTAGARALTESPGSGESTEHIQRAADAMERFPDAFREERLAWIGE